MPLRRSACEWDPTLMRVESVDDAGNPLGDVWFEEKVESVPSTPATVAPKDKPGNGAARRRVFAMASIVMGVLVVLAMAFIAAAR